MLKKLAFLVVATLVTIQSVAAFSIDVPPQEQRCFVEMLDKDDNLHVSFQVGDGGNLDIDFWITNPSGELVEDARRSPSETFNHVALTKGRYEYCFSNAFSTVTDKTLSFNVIVVKAYVEDTSKSVNRSRWIAAYARTHKADPLANELRELAAGIEEIVNEQEYTIARERTHRNTAESTNWRVMWWSLFQSGLLFVVCAFQITYLKRFFEVKRVV
ncbi:p24 complex component [Linnemannia hyalina]|uniref:P24 complex component n=1 Tax=Linnemannia hyalina TaxID=64524 RepID=A0A9P7Y4M1_9FUNG|nr:p24 complex component [Linnemannia hyalina]